jgi:hypothetical protein
MVQFLSILTSLAIFKTATCVFSAGPSGSVARKEALTEAEDIPQGTQGMVRKGTAEVLMEVSSSGVVRKDVKHTQSDHVSKRRVRGERIPTREAEPVTRKAGLEPARNPNYNGFQPALDANSNSGFQPALDANRGRLIVGDVSQSVDCLSNSISQIRGSYDYNANSRLFTYDFTFGDNAPNFNNNRLFAGLNATVVHFHGPARRGATAGVQLTVVALQGFERLSFQQAQELEGGLWYLNIHSAKCPNGELRAQLDGLNAGFNQGLNAANFNTGFQPALDANFKPGFQPALDANFKPGFQPALDANFKPGLQPALDANFKPGFQPALDANFKPPLNDPFNSGFNANLNPGFDANLKPPLNDPFNSGFNANSNPSFNANFKPPRNDPFNPGFNANLQPSFDANFKRSELPADDTSDGDTSDRDAQDLPAADDTSNGHA